MPKVTISSETAQKLTAYDKTDVYETVDKDVVDEWRWGNVYELIARNKQDGTLWGFTYREQSGDHYYNSLEEENEVEMYQLQAKQVVTTVYERVPEPESTS